MLDALVGSSASADTRQKFRKMLREGALDDREIEVAVQESAAANLPTFEIPACPARRWGCSISATSSARRFGTRSKPKKMTVADSHRVLIAEESDKLLDQDMVVREAIDRGRAERHRLYRRDRQDLRARRARRRRRARCQPRGVQRDLLPLIEGTTVATKHGAVKTDHILFIASGAFHQAKPSDLLPELQGDCRSGSN